LVTIATSILTGTGTAPKNLGVGSEILLDASANTGTTYDWEILSKPKTSETYLKSPNMVRTAIVVDTKGVYQIRLVIDRDEPYVQTGILSLNAPGAISVLPVSDAPVFSTGGRIRNFSFELPGVLAGWAANWLVQDDSSILASHAGTTRGRIIPTNFEVTSGKYAMCLGDDIGNSNFFGIDDIFSVEQDVDFTGMTILKLQIKFRK